MAEAVALAHPNIALIKYWGNRDAELRLPANGSLSITLDGLATRTSVRFDPSLASDQLTLNGRDATGAVLHRVEQHLDRVRSLADLDQHAEVVSQNSFPMGAGIASSASGFAALSLAAAEAAGLQLSRSELSRLARRASGSASRSVLGGFVEWHRGTTDEDSFAESFAPADHWPLVDWVAVVEREEKEIGSSKGHQLAETSPLQPTRVEGAEDRLRACRQAILHRDFTDLAEIVELDSDMMHAVMMTSRPPLLYWRPGTVAVIRKVRELRRAGVAVCYTVDAGPNVHCLCLQGAVETVRTALLALPQVTTLLRGVPGGPARLVSNGLPD